MDGGLFYLRGRLSPSAWADFGELWPYLCNDKPFRGSKGPGRNPLRSFLVDRRPKGRLQLQHVSGVW